MELERWALCEPRAAWARVAAVRRTLAWAARGRARYLGANCARLLREAADTPGLEEPLRAALDALAGELGALDELTGEAVVEGAARAAARLDALLPLPAAGAIPAWPEPEPRAEVVEPDGSDDARDDARGPGPAPAEAPAAGEPGAAPADAPTGDEAAGDGEPARGDGEERAPATPAEPGASREQAPTAPEEAPAGEERAPAAPAGAAAGDEGAAAGEPPSAEAEPAEPPPPRPLGDPEGTGRPVSELPGIRPEEVEALTRAGVERIADLLELPPRGHVRRDIRPVGEVAGGGPTDEPVAVRGRLAWRAVVLGPGGTRRHEAMLADRRGHRLRCAWPGEPPRGWDRWRAGQELGLAGRLDDEGRLVDAEPVGVDGRGSGLMPEYGLEGIPDRRLRDLVAAAIELAVGRVLDPLPEAVRRRHRLVALDAALRDVHFPANRARRGRARLAFDEFLLLQLGAAWKARAERTGRGMRHRALHRGVGQVEVQFELVLDDDQEAAFADIRRDLLRERPMTRLLQGDVGARKREIALLSALVVAENGAQVAMVAPDDLAAERAFLVARPLLGAVGVVPMLVTGGIGHAEADAIRRGEAHVVFGTRRIVQSDVAWRRLGLVVVEERPPYGTFPPSALRDRTPRPDLLVTTRSPIPLRLAFGPYAAFDLSVVPRSRPLSVRCEIWSAADRDRVYERVRGALERGRQAYIVYPVRNGHDLLGRDDAARIARALEAEAFPGRRVGIYASEMPGDERARVFDDFAHRRLDVLVCTTYVEDAPPLPAATEMVVEYADLHELMRLHRLRAHVSLGEVPGTCRLLASEEVDEAGRARLELVRRETDGFRLAEIDHDQRAGDGGPPFRWANPVEDRDLLLAARAEALDLLRNGGLAAHPELVDALNRRWAGWLGGPVRLRPPRRRRRRRRR